MVLCILLLSWVYQPILQVDDVWQGPESDRSYFRQIQKMSSVHLIIWLLEKRLRHASTAVTSLNIFQQRERERERDDSVEDGEVLLFCFQFMYLKFAVCGLRIFSCSSGFSLCYGLGRPCSCSISVEFRRTPLILPARSTPLFSQLDLKNCFSGLLTGKHVLCFWSIVACFSKQNSSIFLGVKTTLGILSSLLLIWDLLSIVLCCWRRS